MIQMRKQDFDWLCSALSHDDERPMLGLIQTVEIDGAVCYCAADGYRLHAWHAPVDVELGKAFLPIDMGAFSHSLFPVNPTDVGISMPLYDFASVWPVSIEWIRTSKSDLLMLPDSDADGDHWLAALYWLADGKLQPAGYVPTGTSGLLRPADDKYRLVQLDVRFVRDAVRFWDPADPLRFGLGQMRIWVIASPASNRRDS